MPNGVTITSAPCTKSQRRLAAKRSFTTAGTIPSGAQWCNDKHRTVHELSAGTARINDHLCSQKIFLKIFQNHAAFCDSESS